MQRLFLMPAPPYLVAEFLNPQRVKPLLLSCQAWHGSRCLCLLFFLCFLFSVASAQTPRLDSLTKALSASPDNDTLQYRLDFQYAQYYYGNSQADSADYYIEKAYRRAQQLNYADGFADYHHFKAVESRGRQLLDTAMMHARKELAWALRAADKNKLAYAYNDVGNMHIYFGNSDSMSFS